MTFDVALEIVGKCVAHVMFKMGLEDTPPPSLVGYSLSDLVEANHLVRDHNSQRNPDGTKTLFMMCDDRLIAALYTATHYRPEPADEAEPIVEYYPDRWSAAQAFEMHDARRTRYFGVHFQGAHVLTVVR